MIKVRANRRPHYSIIENKRKLGVKYRNIGVKNIKLKKSTINNLIIPPYKNGISFKIEYNYYFFKNILNKTEFIEILLKINKLMINNYINLIRKKINIKAHLH